MPSISARNFQCCSAGLYYEGWRMTRTPARTRVLADFIDDIEYDARQNFGPNRE